MTHIKVEVDGVVHWDGEVTDWKAPPTPPPAPPNSIKAADLPPSIRDILARSLCAAIENATGFKYRRV